MGKHVLLVEDNVGIREGLSDFLRLRGYTVDTFEAGVPALEFLESRQRPDIILLDLLLKPDMNGWQFAEVVKETPHLSRIPIIALSGASLDRQQVRQCRADSFLPKPFELEDLMTLIERYVGEDRSEPPEA